MLARIGWLALFVVVAGCGPSTPPKPSAVPKAAKTPELNPAEDAVRVVDPVATALRGAPVGFAAVKVLRFNPAGDRLAVGSGDGVVRIWNVPKKSLVFKISAHENWAFDLDFSPDGKILATGGGDNLIKLWDVETGKQRTETARQEDDIHGVAFSPDGQYVVSGSDDTQVMIWKLESDERQLRTGHDKQVTAVAMRPDGRQFASASRDGTIRLWSLPEGTAETTLAGHDADVLAVTYSPDGKTLASASYDKSVRLWDVANGSVLRILEGHKDWVFCVAMTPEGSFVFSGGGDKSGFLWDQETGKIVQTISFGSDVAAADFSPDGKLLAIGLMSGDVSLYQFENGLLAFHGMLPSAAQPVDVSQAVQLPPAEYLKLHNDAFRQGNPEWSDAVARLATVGDGFTLTILKKIDESKLTAAETELFNRARQQIQDRMENAAKAITPETVRRQLERAALSDLTCDPTETKLVPWTLKTLRSAVDSTAKVRDSITTLQNEYALSPTFEKDLNLLITDLYDKDDGEKSAVDSELAKSLLANAQDRVRSYARRILNPTPRSDYPTQ